MHNFEAMFARDSSLDADKESYLQNQDLSSYETVETVSRRRTVVTNGPITGQQLALP